MASRPPNLLPPFTFTSCGGYSSGATLAAEPKTSTSSSVLLHPAPPHHHDPSLLSLTSSLPTSGAPSSSPASSANLIVGPSTHLKRVREEDPGCTILCPPPPPPVPAPALASSEASTSEWRRVVVVEEEDDETKTPTKAATSTVAGDTTLPADLSTYVRQYKASLRQEMDLIPAEYANLYAAEQGHQSVAEFVQQAKTLIARRTASTLQALHELCVEAGSSPPPLLPLSHSMYHPPVDESDGALCCRKGVSPFGMRNSTGVSQVLVGR